MAGQDRWISCPPFPMVADVSSFVSCSILRWKRSYAFARLPPETNGRRKITSPNAPVYYEGSYFISITLFLILLFT